MIRHIVLFRLTGVDEADRAASFDVLAGALQPLAKTIPSLKSILVARDTSGADGHWDAALMSDHATWEDLAAYQAHPDHLAAVEAIHGAVVDRAVVDFPM